jgi:hypothetical protein
MTSTISKELLTKYRFSDRPSAWILEARAFKRSADLLLEALAKPKTKQKFISMPDASSNHMCIKTVCYLYSVSVELFLKGIYSAVKDDSDQEKTESFGHNVTKLMKKLIAKRQFKRQFTKAAQDEPILNLIDTILEWSGRYHKPNPKAVDRVIEQCFEQVTDQPHMLKPKFSCDYETAKKIGDIANTLQTYTPVPDGSIDHLLFLPF